MIARVSAAALAAALVLAACGEKSPAKPAAAAVQPAPRDPLAITASGDLAASLATSAPELAEVRDMLRAPGRNEADETRMARVGAPVAGRVVDLQAREGDAVRRGQTLAILHSLDLSTAQLSYLKARSQLGLASRAAARAQQLVDADVIGTAELQRRQAELTQAEAEVKAARDQLKVLGLGEAALTRLADTGAINSVTKIEASIGGTVIDRKVTEGQLVQPADGVFLIADLSRVWVIADVPEQNAGGVRTGEEVVVEVPALAGRQQKGALSYVAPTVNPETRTVRVRMDLDNAERLYKPNMLASMLIRGPAQRRLTVPSEAVVREENREYVFVQTGKDAFRLQPVQLGHEHEGRRVLLSGVRDTDVIVVKGAFHLNNERRRRELSGS